MGNLSDKKCGGWAGDAAMVLSPMVTACWPGGGGCGLRLVGGLQPVGEISQQGSPLATDCDHSTCLKTMASAVLDRPPLERMVGCRTMADLFWSEASWPMATRSFADADEVAQAVRDVLAEVPT